MISGRVFLRGIAVAALVACLAFLMSPVHIDSADARGQDISCGRLLSPDSSAAWTKDRQAEMAGGTAGGNVAQCDEAIDSRKTLTIALGVAGAVTLLGTLVVRSSAGRRDD